MCLDKAKGPYTAKKDIIVYKLFDKSNVSPTRLKSYFTGTFWPKEGLISKLVYYYSTVEEGLHAFCEKAPAVSIKGKSKYSVVRMCVIPKGSKYYRGIFRRAKSIASDRMVIKKYYKPKKK